MPGHVAPPPTHSPTDRVRDLVADLIAFLDESRKPPRDPSTGRPSGSSHHYVVAGAIVLDGDTSGMRQNIADIELDLGYPLHYSDLRSSTRRRDAIAAIATIPEWDGYLFETARSLPQRNYSEHHVRAKVLTAAFVHLSVNEGVAQITLETRARPKQGMYHLDLKDHQVLRKLLRRQAVPANVHIRHDDKTERILAVADLLAGARSDFLCRVDPEPYTLIAHRVRAIDTVFDRPS